MRIHSQLPCFSTLPEKNLLEGVRGSHKDSIHALASKPCTTDDLWLYDIPSNMTYARLRSPECVAICMGHSTAKQTSNPDVQNQYRNEIGGDC